MEYVIWAEWRSGSELAEDVAGELGEAFRPTDDSVCVWISPDDLAVLMVAFEVEAESYEGALDTGRAELVAAGARTPAAGTLVRVTSTDDEGYRTWSAS